jgi:hypothetical protein
MLCLQGDGDVNKPTAMRQYKPALPSKYCSVCLCGKRLDLWQAFSSLSGWTGQHLILAPFAAVRKRCPSLSRTKVRQDHCTCWSPLRYCCAIPCRAMGGPKRRLWRKIHIGIDEKTLEIRAIACWAMDAPTLPDLLNQIPPEQELGSVTVDGA